MSDTPTTPDATLSSHAETDEIKTPGKAMADDLVDDATFTMRVAERIESMANALRRVPTGPEGRWLRMMLLDVLGVVHAVSNRLGMLAARVNAATLAGARLVPPAPPQRTEYGEREEGYMVLSPDDTVASIEGAKTPPFVECVRVDPPARADPYDPVQHGRVLWAVYGPTCEPSIICCKLFAYDHNHKKLPASMAPVSSDGHYVAVWGYSVWNGVPAFRTLGQDIRTLAIGPDSVCEFYVSQDAALARLRELTTPVDSSPTSPARPAQAGSPPYGLPPGSEPFDPIAANALDALNTLLARVTRHSPPLDVTQAIGKIADALLTLGRRRDAERCRAATQAIVEEIGASGPMSLEEAVTKVLERLRARPEPPRRAASPGALTGVQRIEQERARQIEKLGYTSTHDDDDHSDRSLALAAVCYAAPIPIFQRIDHPGGAFAFTDPWPWDSSEDARPRDARGELVSPSLDQRIGLLTKAGALLAAEIDRTLRVQAAGTRDET